MLGPFTAGFIEAYPADAARVLEDAIPEVAGEVLGGLPAPVASTVLRAMTPHAGAACLARRSPDAAAALVRELPVELAAALLLRLDTESRRALIGALPRKTALPLRMVLRFPAGSVGSIMDPHVVTVRAETQVGEAIAIARRAPALLRKYLYVLDGAQRLTGTVDARQCMLHEASTPVGRLAHPEPAALRARASQREASRHPEWEQVSVLPVVDHRGVFLGVLRRASLRRAVAESAAREPESELVGLAIDLADLCWETTAALFVDTSKKEGRDSSRRSTGDRDRLP